MYKVKNKIYADAGHVLKYKNRIAYNFGDVDVNDVSEIAIDLENMYVKDGMIYYSNPLIREISLCNTYSEWKSKIISKQFTNDDQIAIILNKDDSEEDAMLYNKMQEWRTWASIVAKKIVNLK